MVKMRLVDAFPTKAGAVGYQKTLKKLGVQFVHVRKVNEGRLKFGVFVGGRKSSMY